MSLESQRDLASLIDIREAATAIRRFLPTPDRVAFDNDERTRAAVNYELAVIGEATKRLSSAFRAAHPSIPWGDIAGMRDHLIHAYDALDSDEIWSTVTKDVPDLLAHVQRLIAGLTKDSR